MNFLRRLFSQPKADAEPAQPEVIESEPEQIEPEAVTPVEAKVGQLGQLVPGLHVGKITNVGKIRERNEDSLYTIESFVQQDYGHELFGIFIVADGMGGHQKGDIASSVAARAAANYLLKDIYLPTLVNTSQSTSPPINEVLASAVERANALVREAAPEGGTTLTVAVVMGNNAYIAHVGDTRAYWFNQNRLKQITEDHSLAQRLKDIGQATPEQVAQVEHVLYRAIGQSNNIEVDTYIQFLPPGSTMLICSDGLWKGVNGDEVIREVLSTAATPQEACEKFVEIANNNGGEDNITAILVSMGVDA